MTYGTGLETPTNREHVTENMRINNLENQQNLYCPNSLAREFFSETIGMYLFILLSLGNIAILVLFPESGLNWTGVALSWGLNLMFGIYLASFNSAGHLNPCVSFCMYLFGDNFSLHQLAAYTLAQLFGAFLAAATVYGVYYSNISKIENGQSATSIFTTYKNPSISTTSAFFTEFTGTALLVGCIFAIIQHKETSKQVPIYVGALLSSIVLSFGYQTAFALNPARDLGPRIFMAMCGYSTFSYSDNYFYIPLIADYLGALFGVGVYILFIKKQLKIE
jgi:aquaglyceroporin related protein